MEFGDGSEPNDIELVEMMSDVERKLWLKVYRRLEGMLIFFGASGGGCSVKSYNNEILRDEMLRLFRELDGFSYSVCELFDLIGVLEMDKRVSRVNFRLWDIYRSRRDGVEMLNGCMVVLMGIGC